ncbi:MAG: LysM peptidoglycan-binding domain-containing protein [Phenylobacterium sp.]|uniref:LysM peptidoglycan-binding domain-containing protein n=1 Tax=Phenylobacterium sp. TaxID=1871053 RepID=UPI00391A6504
MTRAGGILNVRGFTAALLLAATLTLGACATAPKAPPPAPAAPAPLRATPGLTVQQRIEKVVELLGQGDEAQAKVELLQALEDEPGHPAARSLLGQIEVDPKTLLGEKHYTYVVKPGDTISGLADRLLGDRLMFYALARYNGMTKPEELTAGQELMIPGSEKKAAPPAPLRKTLPAPPPKVAAPPSPTSDKVNAKARARVLRSKALQNMNSGAIDTAVALLREALQLDPENFLIQNDMARALRIQAALRARP